MDQQTSPDSVMHFKSRSDEDHGAAGPEMQPGRIRPGPTRASRNSSSSSPNAPLPVNAKYKVHSYNSNGLMTLRFIDDHYPVRSAFSLLNQVLDEYQKKFGESWRTAQTDSTESWSYLDEDPADADKLLRIQRELDETKIILVPFSYFLITLIVPCINYLYSTGSIKLLIVYSLEVRNWTVWLKRVGITDVLQASKEDQFMLYHTLS